MDDTEKSKATVSKMKATASTSQPSFMDMVLEAIKANEEKKGASVPFIRNYIAETYRTVDPNMMKFRLRKALDKGLDNGNIIRPKNSEEAKGMTGRFKLNKIKEPKKEKKSIPEAKEKVAKKKTKKEETKAIKEKSTKKVTSIEAPEKKPKKTSAKVIDLIKVQKWVPTCKVLPDVKQIIITPTI